LSPHRTPCTASVYDRARRLHPHRIPCSVSADDRARRLSPHRTPCTESVHDRARRFETHRTPCNESVYGRVRKFQTRRTPCNDCASSCADKRCTPCTATSTSPRARMAPLCEGPSSASSPCSTRPPSPPPRRPHPGAPYPRSAANRWHPPRAPSKCPAGRRPFAVTFEGSLPDSTSPLGDEIRTTASVADRQKPFEAAPRSAPTRSHVDVRQLRREPRFRR